MAKGEVQDGRVLDTPLKDESVQNTFSSVLCSFGGEAQQLLPWRVLWAVTSTRGWVTMKPKRFIQLPVSGPGTDAGLLMDGIAATGVRDAGEVTWLDGQSGTGRGRSLC